jgi:hypothetical protein
MMQSGSRYSTLSHTSSRSVRRISANRSRWPAHEIATTTKLMKNAKNEGRTSCKASLSDSPLDSSGTWISSTSSVMMIATTPSVSARTRDGSCSRSYL